MKKITLNKDTKIPKKYIKPGNIICHLDYNHFPVLIMIIHKTLGLDRHEVKFIELETNGTLFPDSKVQDIIFARATNGFSSVWLMSKEELATCLLANKMVAKFEKAE